MSELFTILLDILIPIFIVMGIGYFMQKKFRLDLQTLAKLNIYFLVPGFIFVKLYNTEFSPTIFLLVVLFFLLYITTLFIISKVAIKMQRLNRGKGITFSNSIIFFNSGNYGVPVNDLVFRGDPFAMSIQVIILTMQNILTFTYGIFILQSVNVGKLRALLGYFRMPVLYAMAAGIFMNITNLSVPDVIWEPATYISDAMIAMALIMLGAQVAQIEWTSILSPVYVSLLIRLLIGPAIALLIIYILGIDGTAAQALFIASAMPTSVNSSVIAQEYQNHPYMAAQMVLFSTLSSAVTVTGVIYLSRLLFA
ncbi:AEC family transporter [Lentibacillus halophilus]|uniref:AEC family transporter n=1 Tax=Lentibacillus halophilus TaxID=295065 RepID=A0ABP3J712_9BACI